jgi:hypothetical protein
LTRAAAAAAAAAAHDRQPINRSIDQWISEPGESGGIGEVPRAGDLD